MASKKEEQKTLSVNKIDKKLSKLKKASEKVFSYRKAKKLLEQSESLSRDIDFSITTIAKNKFVINKVKKLRSLGRSKDEINDIINNLSIKESEYKNTTFRSKIKYFFVDRKFEGLSVKDILKRVNSADKKVKDSESKESKVFTESTEIDDSLKKNIIEPTKAEKVRTEEINEKIHDYLVKSGDLESAKYVSSLIEKYKKSQEENFEQKKKISNLEKNTKEIAALSIVTKKLYDKMSEIEENMIDEQDTSIDNTKSIQEMINAALLEQQKKFDKEKKSILGMLANGKDSKESKDSKDSNNVLKAILGTTGTIGTAIGARKLYSYFKNKKLAVNDIKNTPDKISEKAKKIKPARTAKTIVDSTPEKTKFKFKSPKLSKYLGKGLGVIGLADEFFNPEEVGVGLGESDSLIADYMRQTDLEKKLYMAQYALKYTQEPSKRELIEKDIELIKQRIKTKKDKEKLAELYELQKKKLEPEQKADIQRRIKILERQTFETPLVQNTNFQEVKNKWSDNSKGYIFPKTTVPIYTQPKKESNNFIDSKMNFNKEQLSNMDKLKTSTSSNKIKVTESGDNTGTAMRFFMDKGFTKEQAAGIVGNLMIESPNLNPNLREYGNGPGYGIAQWTSKDRVKEFEKVMGKSLYESNLDDQLNFLLWELQNHSYFGLSKLVETETAADAALVFMNEFERPGIPHAEKRVRNANKLAETEFSEPEEIGETPSPETPEVSKSAKISETEQTENNLIKNTTNYDRNVIGGNQNNTNNQQNTNLNINNNMQTNENKESSAFDIFIGA